MIFIQRILKGADRKAKGDDDEDDDERERESGQLEATYLPIN